MKKAEFKSYGGEVAYAMFRWLFVIVPILFVLCMAFFMSLDSGGGFLSYSREENFMWALLVFLPLFLSVMTLLWSINYLFCRITKTVGSHHVDAVIHVISYLLSFPGLIGILQLMLYGHYGGIFPSDLYMFSFLILPLWFLCGAYYGIQKIIRVRRQRKETVS